METVVGELTNDRPKAAQAALYYSQSILHKIKVCSLGFTAWICLIILALFLVRF